MGAGAITVEVTRAHCLGGGVNVEIGLRLRAPGDLSPKEAHAMVGQGYAEVVADEPVAEEPVAEEPVADAEESDTEETKEAEGDADPVPPVPDPGEIATGDPAVESRDPVPAKTTRPRGNRGKGK